MLIKQIKLARTKLSLARLRYARRGLGGEDREEIVVLEHQISALDAEIRGLEAEQAELVLKGTRQREDPRTQSEVHPNRWISPHDMIALVGEPSERRVKGYVAESEVLQRISTAANGWFVPESVQARDCAVNLKAISRQLEILEIPELSSDNFGPVATTKE